MKTIVQLMCLICAVVLAPAGQAASRSATMQVSFLVIESCNVQVDARQQSVRCDLATPSMISKPTAEAAQGKAQAASDDSKVVTVTF